MTNPYAIMFVIVVKRARARLRGTRCYLLLWPSRSAIISDRFNANGLKRAWGKRLRMWTVFLFGGSTWFTLTWSQLFVPQFAVWHWGLGHSCRLVSRCIYWSSIIVTLWRCQLDRFNGSSRGNGKFFLKEISGVCERDYFLNCCVIKNFLVVKIIR